jgi:glycine/D-amino acid oxidase-like deaminating enzyme
MGDGTSLGDLARRAVDYCIHAAPFATALGGYVVATGHYRNGILLTPATAVAIADVVAGRARPDLAAFSPLRVQEAFGAVAKGAA